MSPLPLSRIYRREPPVPIIPDPTLRATGRFVAEISYSVGLQEASFIEPKRTLVAIAGDDP
jgi:hypothetical protein